jgi:iron complex outermembrane receptor protein
MQGSWLAMNLHRTPGGLSPNAEIDEGRSPRHQGQLASLLDLPRGFSLDAFLYAYGRLPAVGVPGYAKVDLRLGWRPRKTVEASVSVENLGGGEHLEFQPEFISRGHLVRRAVYGKITYRF